jgi:CheY-like chemotaxis protein
MNLAKDLLHKIDDPSLSFDQRARLCCEIAKQLEEAGSYEGALNAMDEFCPQVGERPQVEGFERGTAALVLLRVGVLTGWIGSIKQISGAQETAKNLISESIAIFGELQQNSGVAEAQIDLAYCYWREGAFDEGRVMLKEALSRLTDSDIELRARALLRSAIIEETANHRNDALRIHGEAALLFDHIENHSLQGNFRNSFANVLKNLGAAENRQDYIDRALIEYAAASYHFERAGHVRYQACVENNLAMLYWKARRFADAHDHLDRAQMLFTSLKDDVHLAQVDETRARVMLAEGKFVDAEKASRRAVHTLEKGDELSLLAEALTTYGMTLTHLGHLEQARSTLERAINVAEQAGDLHSGGMAALTLIEQLGDHLSNHELCATVDRARILLEGTRDVPTLTRLGTCACRGLARVYAFQSRPDWSSFCLKESLHRYEAHYIELALKDSGGRVTRAARLLGLTSHQSLLTMLSGRHKTLSAARTPSAPRRRSLIDHSNEASRAGKKGNKKTRTLKILHVEDDPVVANIMKETLALEGWEVETCAEGTAAVGKINSRARYDLLLLDYDLPGMNGVQLAKQARGLAHRRTIPIIILSATLDEVAAREAGADASLRKPEDISKVTETIAGLVRAKQEVLATKKQE